MAMMELYFVCGDRPRGKMGIWFTCHRGTDEETVRNGKYI